MVETVANSGTATRAINLALQGGGAHGAYSWGVLDALLEDGRFEFEGVSGTSAGAVNGVVLANGLMQGGRDGARAALADFWQSISVDMPMELPLEMPFSFLGNDNSPILPATRMMLNWTQYLSPYQLNPFNFNPLRDRLVERIDFAGLQTHSPVRLFLAATNANTGKLRLFRNGELSVDTVLASACLPMLHHAVEIDGEPYWDGGYSANPAVFPLFYECQSKDNLLVLLAPRSFGELPTGADAIRARALELAFNTSVLREMLMFANVTAFSQAHPGAPGGLEQRLISTRFHLIEADSLQAQYGSATKITVDWPFLRTLHDQGYEEGKRWLTENGDQVGHRSSIDLKARFGA